MEFRTQKLLLVNITFHFNSHLSSFFTMTSRTLWSITCTLVAGNEALVAVEAVAQPQKGKRVPAKIKAPSKSQKQISKRKAQTEDIDVEIVQAEKAHLLAEVEDELVQRSKRVKAFHPHHRALAQQGSFWRLIPSTSISQWQKNLLQSQLSNSSPMSMKWVHMQLEYQMVSFHRLSGYEKHHLHMGNDDIRKCQSCYWYVQFVLQYRLIRWLTAFQGASNLKGIADMSGKKRPNECELHSLQHFYVSILLKWWSRTRAWWSARGCTSRCWCWDIIPTSHHNHHMIPMQIVKLQIVQCRLLKYREKTWIESLRRRRKPRAQTFVCEFSWTTKPRRQDQSSRSHPVW